MAELARRCQAEADERLSRLLSRFEYLLVIVLCAAVGLVLPLRDAPAAGGSSPPLEAEAMRRFFYLGPARFLLLICVPLVLFLLAGTLGARRIRRRWRWRRSLSAGRQCSAMRWRALTRRICPIWKSVTASL